MVNQLGVCVSVCVCVCVCVCVLYWKDAHAWLSAQVRLRDSASQKAEVELTVK